MKWEYRVAKIPEDTDWQTWLNQFGDKGWELVSFLPNRDHVFKRPNYDVAVHSTYEDEHRQTLSELLDIMKTRGVDY